MSTPYLAEIRLTSFAFPPRGWASGGSQPHENRPPFLTLDVIIALQGIFPARA